jgi:hypothetical protein
LALQLRDSCSAGSLVLRFGVDTVTLAGVSSLSVSFHQCSIPIIHLPPTLYNVSLPVLQFSPISIIPPLLHTHLHLNTAVIRRTNGRRAALFLKIEGTRGAQTVLAHSSRCLWLAGWLPAPRRQPAEYGERNIARCGCSPKLWLRS